MKSQRTPLILPAIIAIIVFVSVTYAPAAAQGQSMTQLATLTIPAIEVNAPITPVFVRQLPEGMTWDVSELHQNVGFFDGTSWFGMNSNVVLGGHATTPSGQSDVFYRLDEVHAGDVISVNVAGVVHHYMVSLVYRVDQFDLSPVYPTPYEQLTIITCDLDSYNAGDDSYNKRVVVIARPMGW